MSACKFCGQEIIGANTEAEATALCVCSGAEQLRKRRAAAEEAMNCVDKLFGPGAESNGLVSLPQDLCTSLKALIAHIGEGKLDKVTVVIGTICTVRIGAVGNAIKVERIEGKRYEAIAGAK